jgi:hypothetical protein
LEAVIGIFTAVGRNSQAKDGSAGAFTDCVDLYSKSINSVAAVSGFYSLAPRRRGEGQEEGIFRSSADTLQVEMLWMFRKVETEL